MGRVRIRPKPRKSAVFDQRTLPIGESLGNGIGDADTAGESLTSDTAVIRFDNVTKRFADGTNAVDQLSMDMPTREITVLVGSSGCAKTTTLRMVNRMVDPTAGAITIDDRNVMDLAPHELRRGIGYVIQQVGLFPHKKVIDNVTTVPSILGWDKKRARARAVCPRVAG